MTSAFDRLRVVDFTTTIAGPHCTRLLADLGAEVIKVEAPEGDMMRARPPLRDGASTSFGQLNTGKKSVVLDLKRPAAVGAARRLVASADVVVENFRPGVMQRFGLDYPALKAVKPDLVYCAISGYGQTGPSAELPAYAPVIHAASGYDLAHLAYQGGERRPDYCGIYIADVLTGTYAFGAIMTALYQRQATGEGQLIDVSMLESMLSLTLSEIQLAQFPGSFVSGRPVFGPIATKDGYVNLSIASERSFQNLAAASGRPDWTRDPRFAKYPDRRANWGLLIEELETWSKQHTSAEVQTHLRSPRGAFLALSHGQGGAGRPAAGASPCARRGRGSGRQLPRPQPAVPVFGRHRRRTALRRRARRAHGGGARRTGLQPERNRRAERRRRADGLTRCRHTPSTRPHRGGGLSVLPPPRWGWVGVGVRSGRVRRLGQFG